MSSAANRIRVLVVDDHPAVRRGLRDLLENYPDIQVIGESGDGLGALHDARRLLPDVILLDMGLPGLSGIEVARKLHRVAATVRIIMLTNYHAEDIAGAINGCIDGFLSKSDSAEDIAEAIRVVSRGQRWGLLTK